MRYYAHFGHKDFILCLGYRGDMIKEFFLSYNEALSNDFTLSQGGQQIDLHASDIDDWRITFIDTGLHSNIGERLMAVRDHVAAEKMFLANYSDGLADVPLDAMIQDFTSKDAVASFVAVKTLHSFHVARLTESNYVQSMGAMHDSGFWVNGGFFVFRNTIFDYMEPGDEIVERPFAKLVAERKLIGFPHQGFWRAMDTFKDKITFDREYAHGQAPWELWRKPSTPSRR
jgi:glucose-1-phosphate cytidylyltransferase